MDQYPVKIYGVLVTKVANPVKIYGVLVTKVANRLMFLEKNVYVLLSV